MLVQQSLPKGRGVYAVAICKFVGVDGCLGQARFQLLQLVVSEVQVFIAALDTEAGHCVKVFVSHHIEKKEQESLKRVLVNRLSDEIENAKLTAKENLLELKLQAQEAERLNAALTQHPVLALSEAPAEDGHRLF